MEQFLHLSWTDDSDRRDMHSQTILYYSEKFNKKKTGIMLRKLVECESKAYRYFLVLRVIIKPLHFCFDLEHNWRLPGKLDSQASYTSESYWCGQLVGCCPHDKGSILVHIEGYEFYNDFSADVASNVCLFLF